MLATVPVEPFFDDKAVQRKAGNLPPLRLPLFQLRELPRDESESIGPLRKFREVVDGLNERISLIHVAVRQRVLQVGADLLLLER